MIDPLSPSELYTKLEAERKENAEMRARLKYVETGSRQWQKTALELDEKLNGKSNFCHLCEQANRKLAVATEALNRLDKITVLAESARYIIKEALVTIEGNHE
jgi:hypothetical protein